MSFTPKDHTWALCAYGESPYLEECIRSLKAQAAPSRIILSTSTPSAYIDEIAGRYDLPVFTHEGGGIGRDICVWRDMTKGEGPALTAKLDEDAARSVAFLRGLWG